MTATRKRRLPIPALAVVLGAVLIWLTMWRFSLAGDDSAAAIRIEHAEADDAQSTTMASERTAVPELPTRRGRPTPEELRPDYTIKFAIDRWPGWAPLVYANGGFKAGKKWTTFGPRIRPFFVELVVIDSPTQMRAALAAGSINAASATVDMLPFMIDELRKAPETRPQVMQQLDWSNGGDGIVVRKDIATIDDLVHKTVVVVEHSPAHFFLLAALFDAGIAANQVELRFAKTATEAVNAFNHDPAIAACVTRAPDLYALVKDGNKLLVTTKTSNKLIADVWFVRDDYATRLPGVLRSVGRGILDAMVELEGNAAARQKVAGWMAERTSSSVDDVLRTLGDLHWTNFAANREFLFDTNNPTSFERTYEAAALVLPHTGKDIMPFDQLCEFTLVGPLAGIASYAAQTDNYPSNHEPWSITKIQTGAGETLARTHTIQFASNSYDPYLKTKQGLYDPNIERTMQEISTVAAKYGPSARIVIEGHADSSYRAWVDEQQQIKLSTDRANAVKKALIDRVPSLQADQIVAKGLGTSQPASRGDPSNHARNRRVQITLYRADPR